MQTITFDLVLLDLKMPGMDGTETLRKIRKIDQHVPVYVVTAFQNEFVDQLREMINDGIFFELLNKPVEKEQLLLAVEGILEGPLTV
jgi:CheY-like chemotaxis protein